MIPKRKPDAKLWEEVKHLAEGTANDKLCAVDISFDRYYELPKDIDYLLLKLADSKQPEQVRMRIAEKTASMTALPIGLYLDLLAILEKDPSPGVKQVVDREAKRIRKIMEPAIREVMTTIEALEAIQKQLRSVQPFYPRDLQTTILKVGKIYKEQAKIVTRDVTSFYSPQDLLSIREFKPSKRPENPLIRKLNECPAGQAYWKEYQGLCREILEWLFVPPLSPPLEDVGTKSGLQKRDLIFPIPYDVTGFWELIRLNYHSCALIVECKNYTDFVPSNEVVITSKYFGRKKCGLFGILVTRKGLSNSAKKEQERLWLEDDKMIICLSDEDLIKMINLRDGGQDAEMVLDDKIFQLRMSLE